MKRITKVILSILLVFGLFGCSGNKLKGKWIGGWGSLEFDKDTVLFTIETDFLSDSVLLNYEVKDGKLRLYLGNYDELFRVPVTSLLMVNTREKENHPYLHNRLKIMIKKDPM